MGRTAARVAGSALPAGVMMRAGDRVGVAVPAGDGRVQSVALHAPPPRGGRLARLPVLRGVAALRDAGVTGRRAIAVAERMRAGRAELPPPWVLALAAVAGVLVQVAVFRVGPVVIAKEAGLTGAAFVWADAAIRLALVLSTLRVAVLAPGARRLLAFHGAEHQAIACLEAGGGLDAAAAARHSRFHPRCGTSFLVGSALLSVPVYGAVLALTGAFTYPALIGTRIVLAPLVAGLALEAQRAIARGRGPLARALARPGLWAQRLTTAAPSAAELAVAVEALRVALGAPASGFAPSPAREHRVRTRIRHQEAAMYIGIGTVLAIILIIILLIIIF